jgi:hypothetical protein
MEHTPTGIWLNGGYYVSIPKVSSIKGEYKKNATGLTKAENERAIKFKEANKNKAEGLKASQKIIAIGLLESQHKVAFKLRGKINGIGTTPSMQLGHTRSPDEM